VGLDYNLKNMISHVLCVMAVRRKVLFKPGLSNAWTEKKALLCQESGI